MKKFLGIVVLGLLFISVASYADDIDDFEIEGMSIGDSALDYFTEEQILNNRMSYYKNKLYTPVEIERVSFFETFESVAFGFKTGDKNYKILGLTGHIDYPNKISDCYKKQDQIISILDDLFNNAKTTNWKSSHEGDISGESIDKAKQYDLQNGDVLRVSCTDWSDKMSFIDKLKVGMYSKEQIQWINTEAYD